MWEGCAPGSCRLRSDCRWSCECLRCKYSPAGLRFKARFHGLFGARRPNWSRHSFDKKYCLKLVLLPSSGCVTLAISMAASVRYTVFELAERAANARGSLQANVQSFWRLHATDPSKALDDLWTCIQHAIVHSQVGTFRTLHDAFPDASSSWYVHQKCTQVNRVLAFVSAIAHTAAEDVRPEQCTQLLSNLLTRLLPLTTLAEALARHRACLLTSTLLNAPALDGGHLQATQQVLTKRLRDRAPAVREQAVLALTRLCATDAKGAAGPIVAALCALLRTERNKVHIWLGADLSKHLHT